MSPLDGAGSIASPGPASGPTEAQHDWASSFCGIDTRAAANETNGAAPAGTETTTGQAVADASGDGPTPASAPGGGGPGAPGGEAPPSKTWQVVSGVATGVYHGGKSLVEGLVDLNNLLEPFTPLGMTRQILDPTAPTIGQSVKTVTDVGKGLGTAAAHPVQTYDAAKKAAADYKKQFLAELAQAEKDGTTTEFYSQFTGRAGFETIMLLIPASKAGEAMEALKAAKGAAELEKLSKTVEVVKETKTLVKAAEIAEPKITKAVVGATEDSGGKAIGLEHRLKTEKSLAIKIATDMKAGGLTPEQAARGVRDAVRYTAEFPPEKLVAGVESTLAKMQKDGCRIVKLKNTWLDAKKSYKGVNVQLLGPDGHEFELQFHTAESFEAKGAKTHDIYDKMKLLKKGSPKWNALNEEQMKIARALRRPDGIETLKDIP